LIPWLKFYGYEVCQFDYGWTGLLGVLLGNKQRARQLASWIEPGDIGIGHSNGCAILHRTGHLGAKWRRLVYINPALNVNAPLAMNVPRCDVYYSPSDRAVLLASLIPGMLWGAMGRYGPHPAMRGYWGHNLELALNHHPVRHSGVFKMIDRFAPLLERELRLQGER
jgi:hypothetical protein